MTLDPHYLIKLFAIIINIIFWINQDPIDSF